MQKEIYIPFNISKKFEDLKVQHMPLKKRFKQSVKLCGKRKILTIESLKPHLNKPIQSAAEDLGFEKFLIFY